MNTDSTKHASEDARSDIAELFGVASNGQSDMEDTRESEGVIHWQSDNSPHRRLNIGVEFDGRYLVLVGVHQQGKDKSIEALSVREWHHSPDAEELADCMRAFANQKCPPVHVVVTTPRSMVRRFPLPAISTRKRLAAARWEGQKLIPFPLDEEDALFGMDFLKDDQSGWWVTLAATPRSDSAVLFDAIAQLDWQLNKVSLMGTHVPSLGFPSEDKTDSRAVVIWSKQCGTFTVFHEGHLQFYYDLGPMPLKPAVPQASDEEAVRDAWKSWVESLGVAIAAPFDFYLSKRSSLPPKRVEIIGPPESIAPMLSQWQERFGAAVSVVDPTARFSGTMPEHIADWMSNHTGLLTPAVLSATGSSAVDLTPAPVRRQHKQIRLKQTARIVFAVSLGIMGASTALQWHDLNHRRESLATAQEQVDLFERSSAVELVRRQSAVLESLRSRLDIVKRSGPLWMPWVKTMMGTIPGNGALTDVELIARPTPKGGSDPIVDVNLSGILRPSGRPHALTYRSWMDHLQKLGASDRHPTLQTREVTWKGHVRSIFSLSMQPTLATGREQP